MDKKTEFYKQRHVKFFSRCLDVLPNAYQTLDTNRMTVLFFAIFGLDILGELEKVIDDQRRREIISWVYSLQALRSTEHLEDNKRNHLQKERNNLERNGTDSQQQTVPSSTEEENDSDAKGKYVTSNGDAAFGVADDDLVDAKKEDNSGADERISAMLGFRSSPGNGARLSSAAIPPHSGSTSGFYGCPVDNLFDSSHVTMTYNALAILLILKDDLSGVDRTAVLRGLKHLQQHDGSFSPMSDGGERDMRFVFCAAAICSILADRSGQGMDVQKAVHFVTSSLTYEGGFGMSADAEAHGGSSFCAIASLKLLHTLDDSLSQKQIQELKRWLCFRQANGFQGRANKPVDCCYTFWVGASLKLLEAFSLAQISSNVNFTLSCQNPITGGFAKWPDCHPDALHACLGLAGLSILENEITNKSVEDKLDNGESAKDKGVSPLGLRPIHPPLNITQDAFQHLLKIQQSWKILEL